MKKFTKVCLVIASVMFLLCIGCCISGLVMDGNPITAAKNAFGNIAKAFTNIKEDFDESYDLDEFQLLGEYPTDEIRNLVIDMQIGNVVVKSVSGDACRVWADESVVYDGNPISVSEDGHDLCVKNDTDLFDADSSAGFSFSFLDFTELFTNDKVENLGTRVIVEIPENNMHTIDAQIQLGAIKFYDISMTQMEVIVEAGAVYGEGLITGEFLKVSTGLGSAALDNIECNTVILDAEMGEVQMQSAIAEEFNASVEMGTLNLNDVQANEISADCEMGDINIQLAGEPKDYDIDSNVEMGDIDITHGGGKNDNALYKARLDCEMGDIDVTFAGDAE